MSIKNDIQKLLQSNISLYEVAKETGVSESNLYALSRGERKIGNITLNTAEKLYNFYIEHKGEINMNKFKYSVEAIGDVTRSGDIWSTAWDGDYFDTVEEAYKVVEKLGDREIKDLEFNRHISKDDMTVYISILKTEFDEFDDYVDDEEVKEIQFHKLGDDWLEEKEYQEKVKLMDELLQVAEKALEEDEDNIDLESFVDNLRPVERIDMDTLRKTTHYFYSVDDLEKEFKNAFENKELNEAIKKVIE